MEIKLISKGDCMSEAKQEKKRLKKMRKIEEREEREKNQKYGSLMKKAAFVVLFIAIIAIAWFAITSYMDNIGKSPKAEFSSKVINLGNVSQALGTVKTEIQISNKGEGTLIMSNIVSSCACTTTFFEINGVNSPVFGMHNNPVYSPEIPAGSTAKMFIYYNPNVHEDLRGNVIRIISFNTNDSSNKTVQIRIELNQTA